MLLLTLTKKKIKDVAIKNSQNKLNQINQTRSIVKNKEEELKIGGYEDLIDQNSNENKYENDTEKGY